MCSPYVSQCILHLAWITNPIHVFHDTIPLFPIGCQVSEKTQVLVKSGSSLWSGHIWARFGVSRKEIQKPTGVTWLAQYLLGVTWLFALASHDYHSVCFGITWLPVFGLVSHDYQCLVWCHMTITVFPMEFPAHPTLSYQYCSTLSLNSMEHYTRHIRMCMQRPC